MIHPPPREPAVPEQTQSFAEAARTTPLGAGSWTTELHPSYSLWRGTFVHGGFCLAVVADAMAQATGRPDPVTLTAHFMEQVKLQTATIEVEVLRSGGRHSTAIANLVQDGGVRIRAIGTYGDTSTATGPSHHSQAPACPPWDECFSPRLGGTFREHVDVRFDPKTVGIMEQRVTGSNVCFGRVRFLDDEPVAGPALAFLADVMWSPAIEMGKADLGWIPTVELTLHVHDATHVGEVMLVIRIDHLTNGYATEDVEIWAGDGSRLLATARQLALVRAPS